MSKAPHVIIVGVKSAAVMIAWRDGRFAASVKRRN
jgi:hypothetical protein